MWELATLTLSSLFTKSHTQDEWKKKKKKKDYFLTFPLHCSASIPDTVPKGDSLHLASLLFLPTAFIRGF